jgi:hypothetical protein
VSAAPAGQIRPGQKWVRKFGPTAPVRVTVVTPFRVGFTDNDLRDHYIARTKFLASYVRVRGGAQ